MVGRSMFQVQGDREENLPCWRSGPEKLCCPCEGWRVGHTRLCASEMALSLWGMTRWRHAVVRIRDGAVPVRDDEMAARGCAHPRFRVLTSL